MSVSKLFLPLVFGVTACLALALATCSPSSPSTSEQNRYQTLYDSLYQQARREGATQPDSAMFHARLAADIAEVFKDSAQQADAHHLGGFYADKNGYYGWAIRQYQRAYEVQPLPQQKAAMLHNMAWCYQNAGKPKAAQVVIAKAIENFSRLGNTQRLSYALQLAGNNCLELKNYGGAHDYFYRAISMHSPTQAPHRLASLYTDFARLKERVNQYDSAIHYQRLALKLPLPKLPPNWLCMRLTRLAWYHLLARQAVPARQAIAQAQQIDSTSLLYQVMLSATHSLLLFVERRPQQARQAMQQCDSLLAALRTPKPSLVQQKFVRKLAYEINRSGERVVGGLTFYGDSARYAPHEAWFAQRYHYEKALYDKIVLNIALKDSLVIAQAPQTSFNIVQQISLGWWLALVALLALGGGGVYYSRSRAQRAHTQQLRAQTDFVAALKHSPVKGFENLQPTEIDMLERVQTGLKRALKPYETKMLIMVRRGYTYKRVAVDTGTNEGTIKSRMSRIRKACGDDFLQG